VDSTIRHIPSPQPKRVCTVIPSWNGRHLLEPCLAGLARQRFRDFEIVVVDNGSTDGTRVWLEQAWPEVRIISLPRNLGFSAAVNAGILAGRSPLVALLNNDAVPEPDWLAALVEAAERHPDAGIIASKVLLDRDGLIDSAGIGFHRYGWAFQHACEQPETPDSNTPGNVFGACAAAALYRRDLFDRIGLFDEAFFAYYEDVDICFRAQIAGVPCWYEPRARAIHRRGASSSRMPDFILRLQYRNSWYVLVKNLPAYCILKGLLMLLMGQVFMFQNACRKGHLRVYVASFSEMLSALPRLLQARRRIQEHRGDPRRIDALLDCTLPGKVRRCQAWLRKIAA